MGVESQELWLGVESCDYYTRCSVKVTGTSHADTQSKRPKRDFYFVLLKYRIYRHGQNDVGNLAVTR